ncbi:DNA integrity scanning diadenylate cyclase DisA [Corynebacterium pilosum]|uniref:DNA integrity scanning protein DisA n=1 Tax=Corynebacterium pilosum TaxID=35756 RepID=A0A376CL53_9CORY|nr:DNA integrity scanning diadenylate cyclase DisA [Corynebacterium pilosum]STC68829.1 DNA integrity scanning protein DisA [Corynebacterium pilosum]
MSESSLVPPATLRETLVRLAPGTELRDGLERIQRGRTGALIVLGDDPAVIDVCDGGISFDVPFAPTLLRELSKMDGAVVLSTDCTRIIKANVQLVPSPSYPTGESGTRHRSAERTALQTGRPVIAVSASMNTITLYVEGQRYVLVEPAAIMTRANQQLGTMERYRTRLDLANQRLFVAEMNNYATVSDVISVMQRELLLKRAGQDLDRDVLELGTDARQLALQLTELRGDNDTQINLLVRDYLVCPGVPSAEDVAEVTAALDRLPDSQLLTPAPIARALNLPGTEETLVREIVPRGYRALARVPRVQEFLMDHLIEAFGDLNGLLEASVEEIAEADNVSSLWARHVHEGLQRLS